MFCFLSACKSQSDKSQEDSAVQETWAVDKYEFKKGENLNPKDWNCVKIEDNEICCPSNWKPVQQKSVSYFSYLNNNNKSTFFTIVNYTISESNIDARRYLKLGYSQLLKDTVEKFTGFTVKKLIFQDNEAYYAEYFTEVNKQSYLTYSMLFEKDNYLYDIALKVEKDKSPNYTETFKNILFSLKVKGEQVFDGEDKLEKIEIIDISKL
jgi:hypothetical protein